ncbi:MAG: YhjD/YihY/BrkB family envelope integrity protein [Rubricoccaceae bacterium]
MSALATRARSGLSGSRYYAVGLVRRLGSAPVFLWAQAIAFKVLVTLLPLILLATGIFGLVLQQPNPFETVAAFLQTFLPPQQSGAMIEFIEQLQRASGTLTLVGAGALLVTVITLFSTLRYVIGEAMGDGRHRERSLVAGYLFDIRMVVQVGSLFLLTFFLTLAVNLLTTQGTLLANAFGLDPDVFEQFGRGVLRLLALVIPYAITWAMLAQLYYFVPRPHPPLRSAMIGAAVSAVLFELAKNGFTIYATYIGNFNRYAETSEGLGGLGGAFGLILAFVFWVYVSGLILIVGAIVTSLHERRVAPRRSLIRRLWGRFSRRRHADTDVHDMSGSDARGAPGPDDRDAEASPGEPAGQDDEDDAARERPNAHDSPASPDGRSPDEEGRAPEESGRPAHTQHSSSDVSAAGSAPPAVPDRSRPAPAPGSPNRSPGPATSDPPGAGRVAGAPQRP